MVRKSLSTTAMISGLRLTIGAVALFFPAISGARAQLSNPQLGCIQLTGRTSSSVLARRIASVNSYFQDLSTQLHRRYPRIDTECRSPVKLMVRSVAPENVNQVAVSNAVIIEYRISIVGGIESKPFQFYSLEYDTATRSHTDVRNIMSILGL